MSTSFVFLVGLLLCGLGAPFLQNAQQTAPPAAPATPAAAPAETPIPAAASAMTNPVHPTAASQARAKEIYGFDCEMCHGKGGSGVSEMDSQTKLRDYRDPAALKGLTDGEIFYIIENGRGSMPGEGPRAKPDEIWNLVIYLRSLSKGKT